MQYNFRATDDDMLHPTSAHSWPLPAAQTQSLSERIGALHQQVRRIAVSIDRMACALYDPAEDLLKTFVNSTLGGEALSTYQYHLHDSPSLQALAQTRQPRVIAHIDQALSHDTEHSRWVHEQGYLSSFTVPLFDGEPLIGFLFFDSRLPDAFPPQVVDQLVVYAQLVGLMISHEVTAVQALVGSMRVARDFAHLRDVETGTHLDRMSRYVRLIARGLPPARRPSDEFIEQLFLFSPLHDIGKIGVPDALLLKPERFTTEERQQMQRHVPLGSQMVERLILDFRLGSVAGIDILRNLVACHHEYLDGTGYPHGLRGDAIPLEARIVAVADIFDALSSRRVYKPALSVDKSLAALESMAGLGKLDRECVAVLRTHRDEVHQIIERFAEGAAGH
jgi:HD-GYP domain-containing protein (c-di-GMP phosphodiesterase class II)